MRPIEEGCLLRSVVSGRPLQAARPSTSVRPRGRTETPLKVQRMILEFFAQGWRSEHSESFRTTGHRAREVESPPVSRETRLRQLAVAFAHPLRASFSVPAHAGAAGELDGAGVIPDGGAVRPEATRHPASTALPERHGTPRHVPMYTVPGSAVERSPFSARGVRGKSHPFFL